MKVCCRIIHKSMLIIYPLPKSVCCRTIHPKRLQKLLVQDPSCRIATRIALKRLTMPSTQSKPLSLAERFRRATSSVAQPEMDFEAMSLEEMGRLMIPFGEGEKGQSCAQVVQTDPKYVTWFVNRYGPNPCPSHIGFLTYVRRFVETAEQNVQHAQSKAKAKSAPTKKNPDLPEFSDEEEDLMDEPSWDMMDRQAEQENRLDRLEHSVSAILQQVSDMMKFLSGNPPKQ